jgi:transketolase
MKINRDNTDIMTAFFSQLEKIAKKDKDVIFLTADHGAWALAKFKKNLKNQYINMGISEQNMISVAAGMALNKKKVFVFSITPFVTQRCLEQIKIDVCFPCLPITIVGNGSSLTYASHGTSHQAIEDIPIMRSLPNLKIINPADNDSAKLSVDLAYEVDKPVYIKLDKGFFKDLNFSKQELRKGFVKLNNKNISIITTGSMIHEVNELKKYFETKKIKVSIIYIYIIKPLNKKKIANLIKKNSAIITIEEQHVDGGIGSQICEIISDYNLKIPIKRYGIKDFYSKRYGDRNWLRKVYNLDVEYLKKNISSWLKKINK